MSRKLFGITLAVLSVGLAGFAVFALLDAPRMALLLGALSKAQGQQMNRADWLWHWRVGSAQFLGYGLVGAVAGFAILFRRDWGFLLWAVVASSLFFDNLIVLVAGNPIYAFEATDAGELVVFAGITAVSWLVYHRVVHRARHNA